MTVEIRHAFVLPSHRFRVIEPRRAAPDRRAARRERHLEREQLRADQNLRDPRDMRERQMFDAGKILPFYVF